MRELHSQVTETGFKFIAQSNEVDVSVEPYYLEDQSVPADFQYVWAYRVKISNQRNQAVQLMTRHWIITDANGLTQEVEGPGVLGEQPVLRPGETFEYSSYTILPTSSGFMSGTYRMADDDGRSVTVDIPAFSLDSPEQVALPN